MHLIVQSYNQIELQQLRSELEQRGIAVHVSDEFTYAIPGMPGAEQPRGLWVTLDEDLLPARRVVADLVGQDRLASASENSDSSETPDSHPSAARPSQGSQQMPWFWISLVVLLVIFWLSWS